MIKILAKTLKSGSSQSQPRPHSNYMSIIYNYMRENSTGFDHEIKVQPFQEPNG